METRIPYFAFILMVMFGVPTALLTLVCFFLTERVPSRRARLLLPAAGAVLMPAVSLLYFSGPQSPEEYQLTWAMMMTAGFLSNALVILAPFPFIRRYTARTSHYLVIAVTVLATFFLLTCLGLFGGESQCLWMLPNTRGEYHGDCDPYCRRSRHRQCPVWVHCGTGKKGI